MNKPHPALARPPHPSAAASRQVLRAMYERFAQIEGFNGFLADIGARIKLTSTPGWENGVQNEVQTDGGPVGAPVLVRPGAKPIAMRQWDDAIVVAGLLTLGVRGAKLPYVDPIADGRISMTWAYSSSDGLTLYMSASLVSPNYAWTQMIDGGSRDFSSFDPTEVIASLQTVHANAARKSTDAGSVPDATKERRLADPSPIGSVELGAAAATGGA